MDEIQLERKIGNAIKWLEALVSGKYKQRTSLLGSKKEGFCCWGLACYVSGHRYIPTDGWSNDLYFKIGFKNNGQLVSKVRLMPERVVTLWELNDTLRWTFDEIGRYLISHPENFEPDVAKAIIAHFKNYNYPITRSVKNAEKTYS
jgi:hypothetical protein